MGRDIVAARAGSVVTRAQWRWIVLGTLAVFGLGLLLQLLPLIAAGPVGIWSFAGRLVQCVLALLAAFAVLTDRNWAQLAIVATGVAVAITAIGDGFFVGIIAPLAALFVAVVALATALLFAWLVRRA
jgi:hypothetical protein